MVIETSFVEGKTPLVLECMLDIKNIFSLWAKQAVYCTFIFFKENFTDASEEPIW